MKDNPNSEGYCSSDLTANSHHIYQLPENISQTTRNRRKRAAKESPTADNGVFTLSWSVEWSGSFPIGRVNAESITKRLDTVLNRQKASPTTKREEAVTLSVSLQSVSVHKASHQQQRVEEIETILSNAFQRASANISHSTLFAERSDSHHSPPETKPSSTARRRRFGSILNSASNIQHKTPSPTAFKTQTQSNHCIPCDRYVQIPLSTQTPIKRQSFLEKSRRQMSSTSNTLFQRLFGGASSSTAFSARTPKIEEDEGCFDKENPEQSTEQVRFRRPLPTNLSEIKPKWEIPTTHNAPSLTATPKSSLPSSQWPSKNRKRKPVSAVFGQAVLQRLSSASIALNWGSNATRNTGKHLPSSERRPVSSPLVSTFTTPRKSIGNSELQRHKQLKPPTLVFDEKLGEWIYPIDDEATTKQLKELAYFCKNADKELIYARLRAMPEGAFVLRLSGSRRRCLALSVRVPEEKNPNGLTHYLIVRNEHGFRIKGSKHYFGSIPMLITHHTVISEQLPCRLVFFEWDSSSLFKCRSAANLSCLDNTLKSSVIGTTNANDWAPLETSRSNLSATNQRPKSASTIPNFL